MTDQRPAPRVLPVIAIAFATTVAMWVIGYVCRLPGMPALSSRLLLPLLLACPLAGGMVLGRRPGLGAPWGAAAGAISALLNLIVLGSFLAGDGTSASRPSAIVWIPGSFAVSALIAGAGAAIGAATAARSERAIPAPHWPSAFAAIAAVATLLLLVKGGLVTSTEAGQAVPDWPTTFGSNMFLYPLARMTGGIYYEHAHRLFGALVGLTTIALAAIVWTTDARRWMRGLAIALVAGVIGQGVLGGIWVLLSVDGGAAIPIAERPAALAVGHGALAQIFFALVCLVWVLSTPAWRGAAPRPDLAGGADRALATLLPVLVVAQLVLGAAYRHTFTVEKPLPWPALAHLVFAVVVAVAAGVTGIRAWTRTGAGAIPRLGRAIVVLVAAQILLGVAALVAVLVRRDGADPVEVLLTTAHQVNGALVLAAATMLAAWTRRVIPRVSGETSPSRSARPDPAPAAGSP
jgi:cytochrome c oxidase assembly protein subunit 15